MKARLMPCLLLGLPFSLSSCYDYGPPPATSEMQRGTETRPESARPNTQNRAEDEEGRKIESGTQACLSRFPDQPGHKADQVRCIITATDAVLDQSHPESTQQRRSLGAYAIQLAEREDRGEITREQAENLYMQFFQQTPALAIPPQKEP